MKKVFLLVIIFVLFCIPLFAELTLEEAQQFFANPQKLYEPPNQEYNMDGYYYPALDVYKLWQKAGIKPKPLRKKTDEFLFGYKVGDGKEFILKYPESKLYTNDSLKILRIGSSSRVVSDDFQFLIFKKEKDNWKYLDYVYVLSEKYENPEIKFLDNDLFYVKKEGGSGTGVLEYNNSLYAVAGNKVSHLATLPASGHVSGWGMPFNRKYQSKLDYSDGVLTVNYLISIGANAYEYDPEHFKMYDSFPLFEAKRKAVLLKKGNKLQINPEKSQFTQKDLEALFSGGPRDFYVMFRKEFNKLKEGDVNQKGWYKKFYFPKN